MCVGCCTGTASCPGSRTLGASMRVLAALACACACRRNGMHARTTAMQCPHWRAHAPGAQA
eukprot:4502991-Alexandrium_andersonii.AAC.1